MIRELYIQNYALIDEARLSFENGFVVFTGESGAGKTLMLGAMSLLSGVRADFDIIKIGKEKAVVEGVFEGASKDVFELLSANDLDQFERIIIRRELTRSGRSRAFINDSPVSLNTLKLVSSQLFQIHSQHENLVLKETSFQFDQLDRYANQVDLTNEYASSFQTINVLQRELTNLKEAALQVRKDQDYFRFQYDELIALNLEDSELSNLQEEHSILENAEEILERITEVRANLYSEGGVSDQLNNVDRTLSKISEYSEKLKDIFNRISSVTIEISDIENELESIASSVDTDPGRKELLEDKLDELNRLYAKHQVSSIDELKEVFEEYRLKLSGIDSFDKELKVKQEELNKANEIAQRLAQKISENRHSSIGQFGQVVTNELKQLGMPKAEFAVRIQKADTLNPFGIDKINMLFNANGQDLKPISDVASGGEIARLMLSLKAVQSKSDSDLCLVFDEIDTGVSGEVAKRMGRLMSVLSENRQILAITHSPGVAAQGDQHWKIIKSEENGEVISKFTQLNEDERVSELASMFSGDEVTPAAIESARLLRKP